MAAVSTSLLHCALRSVGVATRKIVLACRHTGSTESRQVALQPLRQCEVPELLLLLPGPARYRFRCASAGRGGVHYLRKRSERLTRGSDIVCCVCRNDHADPVHQCFFEREP